MIEHYWASLPTEVGQDLRSRLPNHLKEHLFITNPYIVDGDNWSRLQCYGAAFSFYTRSIDGYIGVERVVLDRTRDRSGFKIVPSILKDSFKETPAPNFGAIAIYYRQNRHVHAGIYVGHSNDDELILSKANEGNLPLFVDRNQVLLREYNANRVVYYQTELGGRTLEAVYLR